MAIRPEPFKTIERKNVMVNILRKLKKKHEEFDSRMTELGKILGRLVLAHGGKMAKLAKHFVIAMQKLDLQTTKFGKFLGYKALQLKRKYRNRKAAIEDFVKRTAEMRKSLDERFIKSFIFELSVYGVVLTLLIFVLGINVPHPNTLPTKTYRINSTPINVEIPTEDFYMEYQYDNETETEPTTETTETTEFKFEKETESSVAESTETEEYPNNETETETDNTEDFYTDNLYGLTDWEIDMLVQAVQHETNNDPNYYVNFDLNKVQQLMTASIVNRIGQPGFGVGYTTPSNLGEVLENSYQYDNILNELNYFNPNDETTRKNVLAVLTGAVWVPSDLYFERCSSYGEDYWTAQENFENEYNNCYTYYISETWENKNDCGTGVFIIFGGNPSGAF